MAIFDADFKSDKSFLPPTMFVPRKFPFFNMADKMANVFADIMLMPQDSTCNTFTYRFSMFPNTNLTLSLRLHVVWEIQLEYFQKACTLCTKVR